MPVLLFAFFCRRLLFHVIDCRLVFVLSCLGVRLRLRLGLSLIIVLIFPCAGNMSAGECQTVITTSSSSIFCLSMPCLVNVLPCVVSCCLFSLSCVCLVLCCLMLVCYLVLCCVVASLVCRSRVHSHSCSQFLFCVVCLSVWLSLSRLI
jgi:hypothetical protein